MHAVLLIGALLMAPIPPLGVVWGHAARGPAASTPGPADQITEERVEAVLPNSTYRVRGVAVKASGSAQLAAGDAVTVAWKGGRPFRILAHTARRAQGARPIPTKTGGVVEELLLHTVSTELDGFGDPIRASVDVVFRNAEQVTRLNLQDVISGDFEGTTGEFIRTGPVSVGWGQADNTFFVVAQVKEASGPHAGLYRQKFYVFRLGRNAGEVQGATPATATHVKTVDLPVFTLPAKYDSVQYNVPSHLAAPVETRTPVVFPYNAQGSFTSVDGGGFPGIVGARAVLTPDLKIVYFALVTSQTSIDGPAVGNNWGLYDDVDYLIAVREGAGAIIWESTLSDQYGRPGGGHPVINLDAGATSITIYIVRLGFRVVDWSETDPSLRQVTLAVHRRTVDRTHIVIPTVTSTYLTTRTAGVLAGVETPGHTILEWQAAVTSGTSVDIPENSYQEGNTSVVGLTNVALYSATPHHVLWQLGVLTAVGPDAGDATAKVYSLDTRVNADVATATLATAAALTNRLKSLRLLAPAFAYVIAEDAQSGGVSIAGWPPAAERAQFARYLAGQAVVLDVNLGTVIANDATLKPVQGLKALPTTIPALDGVTAAAKFAHHVANDREVLEPLGRYQAS